MDWDSLTEDQAKEKLQEIRDLCKEHYHPKPKTVISLDIDHYSYLDVMSTMMRYSSGFARMTPTGKSIDTIVFDDSADFSKLEARVLERISTKKVYLEPRVKTTRGAGKNPFAEPHISKVKR